MTRHGVFISYAAEDEAEAEALHGQLQQAGLRPFYAGGRLEADGLDLQRCLLDAIHESANFVLLWSPFVDKSQWVALESAIWASMAVAGPRTGGLIALDLGGPSLPAWLRVDLVLPGTQAGELPEILGREDWPALAASGRLGPQIRGEESFGGRVRAAGLAVRGAQAWNGFWRVALPPRLGPDFALANLRMEELARRPMATRLVEVASFTLAAAFVIAAASLLAAMWQRPLQEDHAGEVIGSIVFSACAAQASGLIFSFRLGVLPGVLAALAGAAVGPMGAMAAGLYMRPAPLADGAAVGAAMGAAACSAYGLRRGQTKPSSEKGGVRLLLTAAAPFVLLGVLNLLSQKFAERYPDPPPAVRAIGFVLLGGAMFLPVAIVAWAKARFEERRRKWISPATLAITVWFALTASGTAVAAAVPFGNPFRLSDRVAVGLLSGVVGAGMLSVLSQAVEPSAGEKRAAPLALLILLGVGLPVLRQFHNIHPDQVYPALIFGAAIGAIMAGAVMATGRW